MGHSITSDAWSLKPFKFYRCFSALFPDVSGNSSWNFTWESLEMILQPETKGLREDRLQNKSSCFDFSFPPWQVAINWGSIFGTDRFLSFFGRLLWSRCSGLFRRAWGSILHRKLLGRLSRRCETWELPGCVWKCRVPLNPMVLLIIIPIKLLFHWEDTLFSDKPTWEMSQVTYSHLGEPSSTSDDLGYRLGARVLTCVDPLPCELGLVAFSWGVSLCCRNLLSVSFLPWIAFCKIHGRMNVHNIHNIHNSCALKTGVGSWDIACACRKNTWYIINYHHIIIIFPLKHPFGGVKMFFFFYYPFSDTAIAQRCDWPTEIHLFQNLWTSLARWCFWRLQKSYYS